MAREIKARGLTIDDFPAYSGNVILEVIKKELEDFQVRFDCWYSQKGLRTSGKIEETLAFLKEKGFLYELDGALWFRSTDFGDDKDRVVIKSDKAYTYLAPDIAYHREKFKRGYQWLINLWGPDHHGYISRLKASVQALGGSADSLSVVIVQLATIFRDGKVIEMSTRKGQYITLREVLDEVGTDAGRFFFLMRKTSSHLNFDLETAKKQTAENPVYYVQYAHARIASILRENKPPQVQMSDLDLLKEKEELDLIKKLWQFSFVLYICYSTTDPYMLTVYLQELAEAFHRFYDRHRVLGLDDPALTRARLLLIAGTQTVLSKGLDLCGVSHPEKM
jgi:arginyl-tRNA synthetase